MSNETLSIQRRWARFRLAVIATLLARVPNRGELASLVRALAAQLWTHPITGGPLRLAFATIERWYYQAREAADPLKTLQRKVRRDAGTPRRVSPRVMEELVAQFKAHPSWSMQLHHDNLLASSRNDASLAVPPPPSYPTLVRFMRAAGLHKRKRTSNRDTEAAKRAEARIEQREVRSYEASHVGELWHTDFHACSRPVVTREGELVTPQLCAVCDDRSRLVCHAQWYFAETAENLAHGLSQAFMKRGLPRGLMFDNGKAMHATEMQHGLGRRGVTPQHTLEYSPYQNAKQEVLWVVVEARLMAQLEGIEVLTLDVLNEATIAFFEFDHNRKIHSEIKARPLDAFLAGPSVLRDCPDAEVLRQSFTREVGRRQRTSDGTLTVEGVRYELPSTYRHLRNVTVRYATWDLSHVYLTDPRADVVLRRLLPLDKQANADGRRKWLHPGGAASSAALAMPPGMAPLLREQIEKLRATGLPTPFIPKDA